MASNRVPAELRERLGDEAALGVPEVDHLVPTTRSQPRAVGVKRQAEDALHVTAKQPRQFPGVRIPQRHGAVQPSRGEPAITRKSVYRRLVDELLDLVGGSQPLVAHLVESGKLSLDDLKAIEKAAKKGSK